MNKIALVLCLIVLPAFVFAQAAEMPIIENAKANFGLGMGLDYGGFGGRVTFMPTPKFGVFGSVGYVFVGAGYNVGANFKFNPDKRVTPYLTAMYGYNAVIMVIGASQYDKIYYGPSVGFGIELKRKRKTTNFWNFELIVPIPSSEYQDDIDALKSNPDVEMSDPLPIAISVGYHFGMK